MSGRDFLGRMAAASRLRAREARARIGEAAMARRASETRPPPRLRLDGFDVIAELKRRSPAAGTLTDSSFDAKQQIAAYAEGGACAVSVLTEPDEFQGNLDDLAEAAILLTPRDKPVMRKDFLTEPYQIHEARAAGAGGVLIIVTMLSDASLRELLDCAKDQRLFVLLEGFNTEDLERIAALDLGGHDEPVLAGVNCRDLTNLRVDFSRFATLANALPTALPVVAESGIGSSADIRTVANAGYRLALVGSALMATGDPATSLAEMIAAGRDARAA